MYIMPCKYQNLHFLTLIDVHLPVIFCCWQNKGLKLILKWCFHLYNKIKETSLIEILWSNLTLEQNSSWIWLSAGTPMLVLSRPEYSELALECRQKVKSKNYFAQVSNSTTKFLSVKNAHKCGLNNLLSRALSS